MTLIPFNKPFIAGKELYYVAQAVTFGNLSGDGHFTQLCSGLLKDQLGSEEVLLTPSCTAALEMAAILCDLEPGDEVIMPSYTFVSTANAFVRVGATPVFVDICPDTLNLDASRIEDAITARTRVIAPVHYAGVGCDMERIMAIAERHDLLVVEDAAQAVNAHYNGRSLGSIGHFGCLSFHETKNYICGEGGALAINDERFIERACTVRDKGTNRRAFLRGEVDKYTWVSEGSSYVPSELCSAFLWGQLEQLNEIATRRHAIYQYYRQALKPLEARDLLQLPFTPEDCSSNYHMFYILLPTPHIRDTLLQHLRGCDIHSVIHFVPLHTSPMGRSYVQHSSLPVTDNVSDRLLRLPFFHSISEQEQARVVHEISSFLQSIAVLESKDLPVSQRADAF
jgi:dTDP-4-amino-4,6-dideoxygalactose transaminase